MRARPSGAVTPLPRTSSSFWWVGHARVPIADVACTCRSFVHSRKLRVARPLRSTNPFTAVDRALITLTEPRTTADRPMMGARFVISGSMREHAHGGTRRASETPQSAMATPRALPPKKRLRSLRSPRGRGAAARRADARATTLKGRRVRLRAASSLSSATDHLASTRRDSSLRVDRR